MATTKMVAAKTGRTGKWKKVAAGNKTTAVVEAKALDTARRVRRADKVSTEQRAGKDSFARLLSGQPVAGLAAVNLIREGYPAGILKSTGGFFGVPEARILKIAHVAPTTAHRLQKKAARIDSAATERIYRMGKVTRMAIEVFEDDNKAIEWMRQPNPTLANTAPLDLMDTEPGAQSVQQVLNAIATGGVV